MIEKLKMLVLGSPLEGVARWILGKPDIDFKSSPEYWDERYQLNGNSGAGSYGRLAEFKAEIINDFVSKNSIDSVIEFGCGDGNQLQLGKYKKFIGVDVSPKAIELCKETFAEDGSKTFLTSSEYLGERAQLSMSLDVIYHLVEDQIFEKYMVDLFRASERYVVIYASNHSEVSGVDHVRHRKFTDWVAKEIDGFKLVKQVPNKYADWQNDPKNNSFADFYFYEKYQSE